MKIDKIHVVGRLRTHSSKIDQTRRLSYPRSSPLYNRKAVGSFLLIRNGGWYFGSGTLVCAIQSGRRIISSLFPSLPFYLSFSLFFSCLSFFLLTLLFSLLFSSAFFALLFVSFFLFHHRHYLSLSLSALFISIPSLSSISLSIPIFCQ